MADAEGAVREMELWPDYSEQSWQQRFATLHARHQTLLAQTGKALSGQIERACKAESVNADLLEAAKQALEALRGVDRILHAEGMMKGIQCPAIPVLEDAISLAEKSQ